MTTWNGMRILLTGHTGFKGAWAARWLARAGAEVTGLALPPEPGPNLANILGLEHLAASHYVDLRDTAAIAPVIRRAQPDLVLHLAAQPLVRRSYQDPLGTFASNVMGTANLLDALRCHHMPRAVIVVTSDKVYENDASGRPYQENDRLGGHDPYSASKAATEIVVASYRRSYFAAAGVPLVTARGGNVVGGGDFGEDRLIPDIVRAISERKPVTLRNPGATRPWQHVLDCLAGYFAYGEAALSGMATLPEALNFGPQEGGLGLSVQTVAESLYSAMGISPDIVTKDTGNLHEMASLSINSDAAQRTLGWHPKLNAEATIRKTAAWYAAYLAGENMKSITDAQIDSYLESDK